MFELRRSHLFRDLLYRELGVFSCEFCEISKNTFSYRTPPVAASDFREALPIIVQVNRTMRNIKQ